MGTACQADVARKPNTRGGTDLLLLFRRIIVVVHPSLARLTEQHFIVVFRHILHYYIKLSIVIILVEFVTISI